MGLEPAADIPEAEEFEPERWETAIEDVAQVVALGIDRAQDLADALGDFCSERPGLVKGLGAVAAGVLVGVVLAQITGRRAPSTAKARARVPQTDSLSAGLAGALVEVLSALTQAVRSEQTDARTGTRSQVRRDGRWAAPPRIQMHHVAELLPLAITLAKNRTVRDFLVSSAMKAAHRRT